MQFPPSIKIALPWRRGDKAHLLDLALIGAALLPLLFWGVLSYYEYQNTEKDSEDAVRGKLEVLHGHTTKLLEINALLLDQMAERLDGIPNAQLRRSEEATHFYLARLKERYSDLLGMSAIGPDGTSFGHSHIFPVPRISAADRDYFLAHLRPDGPRLFVSEPLVSRLVNEPGFVISRRRSDADNHFAGIYNASIRASSIMGFWQEATQNKPGEIISLIRSDGTVLLRQPPLPEGAPRKLDPGNGLLKTLQTLEAAGNGNSLRYFRPEATFEGKQRMIAARKIGGFPVLISYSITREAAFESWRAITRGMGVVALTATLAMLLLAWLINRRTLLLSRANRELATARDELRDASQKKDDFLAMLAHELRNPLAAIATSAEVLHRSPERGVRAALQSVLPIIQRQVRQLTHMVDDLLDTARTLHGKLALEEAPVEVLDVLKNVVSAHAAKDPACRFALSGESEGAAVMGDSSRLYQVFDNLVENAVKYGASTVTITVRAAQESVIVEVADNGEGIAPELLPQMFEPFVQGAQSIERSRGGLGLGLALTRRLVELHGGNIQAASQGRGLGSVFTVELPRSAPQPAARTANSQSNISTRRRVLIVEDQADAGEVLRMLLEADGHQVDLAVSGAQGLERMQAAPPDIAFVDIGLPVISGYEFAERVRAKERFTDTLLVALSGYGQEADKQKALAAGFDLHLTKPVTYDGLQAALQQAKQNKPAADSESP